MKILGSLRLSAGSSPRVRGSQLDEAAKIFCSGIIPAGAGLTRSILCILDFLRDHPRGCGAHRWVTASRKTNLGSSPRVRGSHGEVFGSRKCDGIIPAGAGLTERLRAGTQGRRDHPRGCGAHSNQHAYHLAGKGSSPRVRGSLVRFIPDILHAGIIPAGAGLTSSGGGICSYRRDHPRGCGAHTKKSQQLRHSLLLWLPESFTFKYSYRISHLVYSFVSAAT